MSKTIEVMFNDARAKVVGDPQVPSVISLDFKRTRDGWLALASALQQFFGEAPAALERAEIDSIKKTLMTGGWRP